MVNWQLTATTIYCDAVDDEVTLMVHKDGSAKCTGYGKYHEPSGEILNLMKRRSKQLGRKLECEGLECSRVIQYRDKLFVKKAKKGGSKSAIGKVVGPNRGREVV